jgi:hypothetical protein
MTKNEIISLGIGTKLKLIEDSIVTVQGLDQGDQTITFQYEKTPKTAGELEGMTAQGGWIGTKEMSADGAIDAEGPPVDPPPEAAKAQAEGLKTTVRCKWTELRDASKL